MHRRARDKITLALAAAVFDYARTWSGSENLVLVW